MLPCRTCRRALSGIAAAFGHGYLGVLGLPGLADAPLPTPVPALRGAPAVAADAGWGHSVYLGADGVAHAVGRCADFKNTLRHINLRASSPLLQALVARASLALFPADWAPVALPPPRGEAWAHVACSPGGGTALLTARGALYVCGSNAFGQCGQRTASREAVEHVPLRVTQGWPSPAEGIAGVSLGLEHVLAVSRSGGCYAWGRGDRGQLGTGDTAHYTAPVRLLEGQGGEDWLGLRIVAVEAGTSASAALDEAGRLWVWGKMQSLEEGAARGDGRLRKDQLLPRRVAFEDECGAGEGGGAEGGGGSSGSSGGGSAWQSEPRLRADSLPPGALPIAIPDAPPPPPAAGSAPRRVVAVTAGQAHFSLLTDDGRLWMLGMRGRGLQLDDSAGAPGGEAGAGAGAEAEEWLPETHVQSSPLEVQPGLLRGQRVVALRSSLHHSYALTAEGRAYRWGWRGRVEAFDPRRGLGGQQAATAAAAEGAGGGGGAEGAEAALAAPVPALLDLAFGYSHGVAILKQ